jgi:PAS domain S-box-containing protein
MREIAAVIERRSEYCTLSCAKCLVRGWLLIVCVLVLAGGSAQLSFGAQISPPGTVPVLNSFADLKAQDGPESLKSTARSRVNPPVDFEVEYFYLEQFKAPGYQETPEINLVIAVFYPALRFALDHRKEISPRTPVVFSSVTASRLAQAAIWTDDILTTIAQQFPTYCFVDYCIDHGTTGGSYPASVEQGRTAGHLAARVLNGQKPESTPVIHGPPALTQVDLRQLGRWSAPESALPADAIVLYRLPTGWARYGDHIIFDFALVAALALLVIGVLWQRTRSKKGTLRLLESERQYRLMADTIPTLVWICDEKGSVTYLNDKRMAFTGVDSGAGLGDNVWSAFIHPDDLQGVLSANLQALERENGFSKEYRLRRRDGVYRWLLDIAAPRINVDGSFAGFIGSAVDITDQKLAREALEKIGGKLIEAQEEERSRIARELHDNISQRLALLSMELEQAKRASNDSSGGTNVKFEEIRQHCAAIAMDVQALSHKLHSSKLEYLGMVPAIRSLCRELSQQYAVNVEFTNEGVPDFVPQDISLPLFRVTQEALHNAVKHSDVSTFSVCLRGIAGEIQLEVADRGIGFDVERAKQNRGLGIVSMQERVHLVHGIFSIDSQAGCGTRVFVRVPLAGVSEDSRNATD